MAKRLSEIEPGMFNRLTLAFSDRKMEKSFLRETRQQATGLVVAYFPVTLILTALGFAGMIVLFPRMALPRFLGPVLVLVLVTAYLHFRFRFPRGRSLRVLYPPFLGILPGWIFAYLMVAFPDTDLAFWAFLLIALHMLTVCLLAPIVFLDVVVVANAVLYGFVGMAFFLSDLPQVEAVVQSLFLLCIDAICMFVSYDRESRLRVNFYQRRVIEQRERELSVEKEKSEALLLNILPGAVAERLKTGESIADGFDQATVLFCDIVGFTPLSESIGPKRCVELLNEVFCAFDDLAEKHGLEKIKTMGDAYIVAGGLPEHRPDHARAVADMALEMRETAAGVSIPGQGCLEVRIGIHTGPVVAGVIGKRKFAYDLWGDAVNTAERMESHGLPGEIQVTEDTFDILKHGYVFEMRGRIEVKGKGLMEAYLLKGRKQ